MLGWSFQMYKQNGLNYNNNCSQINKTIVYDKNQVSRTDSDLYLGEKYYREEHYDDGTDNGFIPIDMLYYLLGHNGRTT